MLCDSNSSTVPMRSPGMPASFATAPTISPTRTLSRLPTARKTRCLPELPAPLLPPTTERPPRGPDVGATRADAFATFARNTIASRRAPSYNRSAAAAISSASCVSSNGASSAISLADAPPALASVERRAVRSVRVRLSAASLRAGEFQASASPLVMRRKDGSSSGNRSATASTGRVAMASVSASVVAGVSHNTTSATCCDVGCFTTCTACPSTTIPSRSRARSASRNPASVAATTTSDGGSVASSTTRNASARPAAEVIA